MEDQRRISAMRNLGPACEKDLNSVGIFDAQQVIDLGVEETFYRILAGRQKQGLEVRKWINANYLYALYGAIHDVDFREVPQEMKEQYKAMTRRIRKQMSP